MKRMVFIMFIIGLVILNAFIVIKLYLLAAANRSVEQQLRQLSNAYAALKEKPTEIVRREVIKQKSQEDLLMEAVKRVAPAVVSIVITKKVPQLEVVYINPFGNDPFFKNFNVRVPQYRQKGSKEEKVGAGTGFLIGANGFIVTNRHVAEDSDAHYTALLSDGRQKPAQVVYRDDKIDLALLKIEGDNYPAVNIGDSDDLELGQSVFTIGNALGEYNNSVSVGIVSGLKRDLNVLNGNKIEKYKNIIQTDAAINHGNSGGPMVNLKGEVVGINVARANADNIGFAIPINPIKRLVGPYIN